MTQLRIFLISNVLLLITSLVCCQITIQINDNFDYELYFESSEIDPNDYGRTAVVSRTSARLFQPCVKDDESIGLLTRVRDCSAGIVFDTLYHDKRGRYYKIGCCEMPEENVDEILTRNYDNMMHSNLNDNFTSDVIKVSNELNGKKCNNSEGSKGIHLSHQLCTALLGYIEKIDRNFVKAPIAHGCCPINIGGERYFSLVNEVKKFKHRSCISNKNNQACTEAKSSNMPPKSETPYLAKLGINTRSSYQWICGGAIISPKFILTTAHCLQIDKPIKPNIIAIGSNRITNPCCTAICSSPFYNYSYRIVQCACCQQLFDIKRLIAYSYETKKYDDIGLVELKTKITFTTYVYPVILPQSWYYPIRNLTTTEYCKDSSNNGNNQMITMMNSKECTDYYRDKGLNELDEGFIAELQYCARVEWTEDFCENGNLLVLTQKTTNNLPMHVLHGLSSFVHVDRDRQKKYIIYTRVFSYLAWIEGQQIWK